MALTAAVIGCGPGGIAATMALRTSGAMVTCFELAAQPGGIWNAVSTERVSANAYISEHSPRNSRGVLSPIYSSMQCVLPKELMAFDDRSFPLATPQFPHHSAVRKYLQDYATANGVNSITRFNTKVESVRWDRRDGGWKVLTVNVVNGDVFEWTFDAVVVATGAHQSPRFPPQEDTPLAAETQPSFTEAGGVIHHSSTAKDMRQFRGKRVVVVGDGVSAYDHCREIMRAGGTVIHSSLLTPEEDDSESILTFKYLNNLAENAARERANRGSAAASGSEAPIDGRSTSAWLNISAATLAASLPFGRDQQHRATELLNKWLRYRTSHVLRVPRCGKIVKFSGKHVVMEPDPTSPRSVAAVVRSAAEATAVKKARAAAAERRKREGSMGESEDERGHFDIDELSAGDASPSPAPEIPRWTMVDDIDAVVYCTGYNLSFPFLEQRVRDVVENRQGFTQIGTETRRQSLSTSAGTPRGLFLGTVLASNPSLAFLGTQQDLLPPFMLLQGQARFAAHVLTGRYYLPTSAVVADSDEEARRIEAANESLLHKCEAAIIASTPGLRTGELYRTRGLGVSSIAFHDMLMNELFTSGLRNAHIAASDESDAAARVRESRRPTHSLPAAHASAGIKQPTFLQRLTKRRWYMVASAFVAVYNRFRSWAPPIRKKQHVLVSNKI